MPDYLHNDPEFKDLLNIVSAKEGIDITLVEKDYWIMHVLFGLQQMGIDFELVVQFIMLAVVAVVLQITIEMINLGR